LDRKLKIVFVSPCYNAEKNLKNLIGSIASQNDSRWHHVIIDDISSDNTYEIALELTQSDSRFTVIKNTEKKYALRNIIETSRMFQNDNAVIATVDGDDSLCNESTVNKVLQCYTAGSDIVWTAHKWDLKNLNISKEMPGNVNPYQWPWCSSHLRTFRSSLLKDISDENFKDWNGEWFKRGYDQALMLPLLYKTQKRFYLNEVCYQYNIESVSMTSSERIKADHSQISTVNFVRSRGFMS
jgi:glycosyltransferase involved in cell wall biosynthesis